MSRAEVIVYEAEPLWAPTVPKVSEVPRKVRQWTWELFDGDVLLAHGAVDAFDGGEVAVWKRAERAAEGLGYEVAR